MSLRTKLTARGRTVLVVVVALVLASTVVGVVVVRSIFGNHCEVTVSGRVVRLSQDDAERVTAAAATAARDGENVRNAVARTTDLSSADTQAVEAAVTGRAHAALTCTDGGADDSRASPLDAEGLTAHAERVRADIGSRFGHLSLGGFAPGGVTTGHMPGSAHYEGRAIDVFFRPITTANKNHGWAFAQYLVASADRLQIATVIFDGKIWTAHGGFRGWRDYSVSHENKSAATVAILEHRDHVHVDVPD